MSYTYTRKRASLDFLFKGKSHSLWSKSRVSSSDSLTPVETPTEGKTSGDLRSQRKPATNDGSAVARESKCQIFALWYAVVVSTVAVIIGTLCIAGENFLPFFFKFI